MKLLGQRGAESLFSGLKKKRIKKQIYKNRQSASAVISDYIESFYNPTNRHSHVGVSPEAFEAIANQPRRRVH